MSDFLNCASSSGSILDQRSAEIASALDRWTAAIGAGGELPSLIAKLKVCEEDRARVDAERRELDAIRRLAGHDVQRIERDLRQRVDEWRTAARRNVAQGRQVLRKLLNQTRVTMRPLDDGMCELSGRADYGKLFSGIVATAMASPRGSTTSRSSHLFECSEPPKRERATARVGSIPGGWAGLISSLNGR